MRFTLLTLLIILSAACAHMDQSFEGETAPVCGRIRFIANGEEVTWGAVFDRPTPELYHTEAQKFINRIALAGGGLFTEAVERDGTFCWRLKAGTYFISRIVPFQGSSPSTLDDRRVFVFPGVAFHVDKALRPMYVGTLKIVASVRKEDFMGNRWMTDKPSIEIMDEFEGDRLIMRDRHELVELDKKLMVRIPELVDVPFHPAIPEIPAILRNLPLYLLMP